MRQSKCKWFRGKILTSNVEKCYCFRRGSESVARPALIPSCVFLHYAIYNETSVSIDSSSRHQSWTPLDVIPIMVPSISNVVWVTLSLAGQLYAGPFDSCHILWPDHYVGIPWNVHDIRQCYLLTGFFSKSQKGQILVKKNKQTVIRTRRGFLQGNPVQPSILFCWDLNKNNSYLYCESNGTLFSCQTILSLLDFFHA